jgi:4-aminobutyrate aminotransferase
MIGIELVDDAGCPAGPTARALADHSLEHGLILRTSRYGRGNVLKIRPPLIITSEEADLLCDRLDHLFAAVLG